MDATEQGDEDQLRQAIVEEGMQIDTLREQMAKVRAHIAQANRDKQELQDKNMRVYHVAGERNAELA